MRIVYTVLGAEVAGGETVCLQLMRAARQRGHVCCLLVPGLGSVAEIARKENFEVFVLPLQRTFHLHRAIVFARFLIKWRADLVHTHTTLPGMVFARLGAKLAGVPIICHVHLEHTFNRHNAIRYWQRSIDNFTARFCTSIIAVSEDTRRALLRSGNPSNKICVIPNGVKIAEVTQQPRDDFYSRFGIPLDSKLIGCVARLDPIKGQRDLLIAGVDICRAEAYTALIFVGADIAAGGRYADELADLAEQLGIAQKVYFLGFQPDAPQLIEAFHIFVLPSYREAMPMSILEAMAIGKPVVATNVNGVPEVVVDSKTGFLVAPGEPKALALAIIKLLRDPTLARQFGLAGQKRVAECFDLESLHNRIFALYDVARSNSSG